MHHIFVHAAKPEDWQKNLANPQKHWRLGYSAWALAHCWMATEGFPIEINRLFEASGIPTFQTVTPLIIIPEYLVALPPLKGHPSQNDLFVLAKSADGDLISLTVEGKVSESFDKTVGDWLAKPTRGKKVRLEHIQNLLGLSDIPPHIRYQLLHRTASAITEALRFNANYAAMIVHSFSQQDSWFEDFAAFIRLYGVQSQPGQLFHLVNTQGVELFAGWARGDVKYLEVLP